MSDMPEEVWIDRQDQTFQAYLEDGDLLERYVRADLVEEDLRIAKMGALLMKNAKVERDELLAIRDELLHHLEVFTDQSPSADDAITRVRARIQECGDGWVPPAKPWGSRRRA